MIPFQARPQPAAQPNILQRFSQRNQAPQAGGEDWFASNDPTGTYAQWMSHEMGGSAGGGTFTQGSSYQDLLSALNQSHAAPGSDEFNRITGAYTQALGLQGGPGNGFQYGQLDSGRNKVYVPGGFDLKFENGQWNAHPEGPSGGEDSQGFGDYTAPFTEQFSFKDFVAPTMADVKNTPGYQFRADEGRKTLERSASAKGLLRTGGTAEALEQYGQDYATNEYGTAYNRAADAYNRDYSNAANQYLTRYNIFAGNQDRPFNKLLGVTQLGANAAGQQAGLNASFGNSYSNLLNGGTGAYNEDLYGGANANASGQIGSSNAWNSLYQSLPGYAGLLPKAQQPQGGLPGYPLYRPS